MAPVTRTKETKNCMMGNGARFESGVGVSTLSGCCDTDSELQLHPFYTIHVMCRTKARTRFVFFFTKLSVILTFLHNNHHPLSGFRTGEVIGASHQTSDTRSWMCW